MLYQPKEYIKFLISSTNQHGVHSPFVFDLVTKCFYNKTNYKEYELLKSYQKKLLHDKGTIEISDFGSGSRIFKSNLRPVSKIARYSSTRLKRAKLLFRLSRYFKPTQILELGTCLGMSSFALALGNSNAYLTSIEGCKNTQMIAKIQLNQFGIENLNLINQKFEEAIPKLINQKYDFIFFDGNHHKKATLSYFEQLLVTAKNDSVFIFDDIYWSKGMTQAWESIKAHPKVSVTIDTFYWGLVFFRKEQEKEHFKIRL